MNTIPLEKNYPKAWALYTEWLLKVHYPKVNDRLADKLRERFIFVATPNGTQVRIKAGIVEKEGTSEWFENVEDRWFYDFFDEHNIFINVYANTFESPEKRFESGVDQLTKERTRGFGGGFYKTRLEAEEASVEGAFHFLEYELNEKK